MASSFFKLVFESKIQARLQLISESN